MHHPGDRKAKGDKKAKGDEPYRSRQHQAHHDGHQGDHTGHVEEVAHLVLVVWIRVYFRYCIIWQCVPPFYTYN